MTRNGLHGVHSNTIQRSGVYQLYNCTPKFRWYAVHFNSRISIYYMNTFIISSIDVKPEFMSRVWYRPKSSERWNTGQPISTVAWRVFRRINSKRHGCTCNQIKAHCISLVIIIFDDGLVPRSAITSLVLSSSIFRPTWEYSLRRRNERAIITMIMLLP